MQTQSLWQRVRSYVAAAAGDARNAWLLTALAVFLTCVGATQALKAVWQEAKADLTTANRRQHVDVAFWLHERGVDMRNLVQVHDLLAGQPGACQRFDPSCRAMMAQMMEAVCANGGFRSIVLVDKAGQVLLRVGKELDSAEQDLLRQADAKVGLVPQILGFVTQGPDHAYLAHRIQSGGSETRALVAFSDPRAALHSLLSQGGDHYETMASAVVRQSGRHAHGLALNPQGVQSIDLSEPPPESVIAQLASGQQVEGLPFQGLDYQGRPVLAIGTRVLGTDWWLHSKIDRLDIFEQALPGILQILLAGLFTIGVFWSLLSMQRQAVRLHASRRLAQEQQDRLHALELLSSIAETSEDVIFAKDRSHRYLLFNPAAQRLSALTAEQVLGQRDVDLIEGDLAQMFHAQDKEVLDQGRALHWEVELRAPEARTLSIVKSPLRRSDGEIIGVFGIGHDITAIKRAEERLRASESRFRTLFDESGVAMVLIDLDTFKISDANRQALLDTGCRSIAELESLAFAPAPWSRNEARATITKLKQRFERGEPASLRTEWLNARRDGGFYWVDLQLQVIELEGRPALLSVGVDIDDRKRIEQELSKLSLALEQSPVSVIITDTEGLIDYVNAAFTRASGYSAREVMGKNPSLLASGQTAPGVYVEMWETLLRGEPWQGMLHNRRKSGELYVDRVAIFPLRREDGRVTHYVALQVDVSERMAIEAELNQHRIHLEDLVTQRTAQLSEATRRAEAANASKSAFLANMSHEIRTPMNAVLGAARLMQRDLSALQNPTPQTTQDSVARLLSRVQQIDQTGRHLLTLLNDLLDLSKIDAGKIKLVHADFALRPLIDELLLMVRERAAEQEVALVLDLEGVPAALHGDGLRLGQILLNYLSNAVRFTQRGQVCVRARLLSQDGGSLLVRFEVEDQGIGISEAEQARLFQVFEQAAEDTAHRFGGTGLGLAIARKLAELMGGQVGVRSQPGQGSCFWVELPMAQAHESTLPTPSATGEQALLQLRGLGPRRVLLVDDVAINLEIASDLLRDAGLEVQVASDGLEALSLAQRESFDLVLMDLRMPKMGGIEATRELRQLPGYESVPVIALTAQAFEEDRKDCQQAGMNDHLSKPVLPELLYAKLLQWLLPEAQRPANAGAAPVASAPPSTPTSASEPEPEPSLPADLLQMEGFDVAAAQRLLGRRLGRLPGLLARFGREQGDACERIEAALAQGDRASASRIAHSMKGTAASLGLVMISELAAELESNLRDASSDDVGPLKTRLAQDTPRLMALEPPG
ncbi:PAS domain S-box protein [Roseateles sp.]|uniref:PAS domain-containing hybrid sensor histidine kinase/response regulator n=1 Tax=Roseateles sp. TaxID=1971397 RepID=UPI003BA6A9FB